MKTFFFILFIGIFSPILSAQNAWKLEKESKGVKVYTRFVQGWGIKEFKAVVEVSCSLADAEAVLRDAPNRQKWMHDTYDTKDLSGSSQNEVYSYSVVDAPWPVSDRDNVVKMAYSYPSPKQVVVAMSAAPKHIPEVSGVVRIQRLQGEWRFTDLGNGKVEIIQQCMADIGGNIPDWLANSSVIDSPFNTLLKMKQQIEAYIGARKLLRKN